MKKFILAAALLFSSLLPSVPGYCTVSVQTPTVSYAADGTTTVWPFSYKAFLSTDINLYVQNSLGVKTLITSNYSVSINAGTVTYPTVASGLSPIASGNTIIIQRAEPLNQLLHITSQGTFDAGNIETAFDKLTMIAQDHAVAIAAGVAGPQGPTGATGPQGSTGSTGATGPAGTPTWKGTWSSITAYAIGDAVYDTTAGASYVCNTAHTNHEPPNVTYWDVMTKKGDTGATGPTGPAGSGSGDVLGPATNHASYIPQWNGANSKTLLDGLVLDVDGTLAANADTSVASQKAVKTYADTKAAKGANSDITSLTAISTPLSVAQGGTGIATLTIHGVVIGQTTGAVHITAAGTAAQVLTSNGASADPTFQTLTGGSGALLSKTIFTSSGTWTKPAGCNQVVVEALGGGGAGGASLNDTGSGGGMGGHGIRFIKGGLGATETVTVGAGGVAGSSGGSVGGTGGTSSFGTWLSCTGGLGGRYADPFGGFGSGGSATGAVVYEPGGAGGTSTSGDINITGWSGSNGFYLIAAATNFSGTSWLSGAGANSPYGIGGAGVSSGAGNAGTGYGSGGSGRGNTSGGPSAGAGAPGIVIVWEYA